jgi:hypothetical protein
VTPPAVLERALVRASPKPVVTWVLFLLAAALLDFAIGVAAGFPKYAAVEACAVLTGSVIEHRAACG